MALESKLNRKQIIIIIAGLVGLLLCSLLLNRYISNKTKVYILEEFSQTGQLLGTNEYTIRNGDTILHGKFVNYNEEGNKISEGQFVNGNIYGRCIYYYDNGNIKSSFFKKTSKINLEAFFNYSDGKIERYAFYDDVGNLAFLIKYDKKGVVDSYRGAPQIEIYQYKHANKEQFKIKENQYLKVGDTLKYTYLVANIPNTKRSFKIENVSVDDSKTKRTLKQVPPTQIDVEEVLTKKGKNTIRSIVQYTFEDKVTSALTDTIFFEVQVH